MRLTDIVNRAGRSLRGAKARTLLTSLAIGVGAFTITLSFAAGEGGRGYTDAIVTANTSRTEILVSQPQPEQVEGPRKYSESGGPTSIESSSGGLSVAGQIEFLKSDDIDKINSIENVVSVSPNYNPTVRYITTEGADRYLVDAITIFSIGVLGEYSAGSVDGGLLDDEIILPASYSEALGFASPADAIGKKVTIKADRLSVPPSAPESKDFEYTIRAVSSDSGMALRTQISLQLSHDAVKELYTYVHEGTRSYGNFLIAAVEVDNEGNVEVVRDRLVDAGYEAQTSEDILGVVNTFINVLQTILVGFGALAVLTSVFGIINTQYISVLERTQQIGLMKALGMRGRDVGRLFKVEAAWIGFLGGAIGSILAVVIGSIANPHISESLGIGDVYLLSFNPLAVSGVIVGLMLVAVLAGIAPARKASGLDPIEALRTE